MFSFIFTIGLVGFELRCHNPLQDPDLSTLPGFLRELLDDIQTPQLIGSNSALELLSHCTLNLHQLDMYYLIVPPTSLKDLLEPNKNSI